MTTYVFGALPAIDPTTNSVVRNTSGFVYAISDSAFNTPLPIRDMSDVPMTAVKIGPLGVTADFKVDDNPEVIWKSGEHIIPLMSYKAVLTAAQGAQAASLDSAAAAASSAAASSSSASAAAASAALVGSPAGTAINAHLGGPANGLIGSDGKVLLTKLPDGVGGSGDVTSTDLADGLAGAVTEATTAANAYTDSRVDALTPALLYAQRQWDPGTSTWGARPAVPAGTIVTAFSTRYPAATAPPDSEDQDIWYAAKSSAFWPA